MVARKAHAMAARPQVCVSSPHTLGRGFESHLRHGCLSLVCVALSCVEALRRAGNLCKGPYLMS
jgi:hypothetical protein